jgi:hypothetical protein
MKILTWFAGLGLLGLAMIVVGASGATLSRDGLAIGGSVIVGAVAVSFAILAAAKN